MNAKTLATHKRYNHSAKGLARYARYRDTDSCREAERNRMRRKTQPLREFKRLMGLN